MYLLLIGKQLDSLADIITFGVAPGVVMMVVLTIDIKSIGFISPQFVKDGFDLWFEGLFDGRVSLIPFAGLIIPFFSLFRLAKFNIDTRQSESFIGVPTPANTLLFMTFPLVLNSIQDVTLVHEVLFSPYLACAILTKELSYLDG